MAACASADDGPLGKLIGRVAAKVGPGPHLDFNTLEEAVNADAVEHHVAITAKRLNFIRTELAVREEAAKPVIRKQSKLKKGEQLPENAVLYGQYLAENDGKPVVVEYEADSELRDTEQIPLLEEGGIEAFIRREVLPHVPDAWIDGDKTVVGYEIPFTRHFYKYVPPRPLEEIEAEIRVLEGEIVKALAAVGR
jgi:type I restriction enzyme M protein